jgi:hypothetical protein
MVYLQTTIFSFVNINLEQNKTLVSICVTPDIKWTIPGSSLVQICVLTECQKYAGTKQDVLWVWGKIIVS